MEDERHRYELEVGRLVTRFNRIEQFFLELSALGLGVDIQRASIVFSQHHQFGARFGLVKSLLPAVLGDSELAIWEKISEDLQQVAITRNSAVHGIFARYQSLTVGPDGHESFGPVVGGRKIQDAHNRIVDTTAITKAVSKADDLLLRLKRLSETLKARPPGPGTIVRARPRTGKK